MTSPVSRDRLDAMNAVEHLAEMRAEWTSPPSDDVLIRPEWPLRLVAALDAVLALHREERGEDNLLRVGWCDVCVVKYPCPTVAAITDALGGAE